MAPERGGICNDFFGHMERKSDDDWVKVSSEGTGTEGIRC